MFLLLFSLYLDWRVLSDSFFFLSFFKVFISFFSMLHVYVILTQTSSLNTTVDSYSWNWTRLLTYIITLREIVVHGTEQWFSSPFIQTVFWGVTFVSWWKPDMSCLEMHQSDSFLRLYTNIITRGIFNIYCVSNFDQFILDVRMHDLLTLEFKIDEPDSLNIQNRCWLDRHLENTSLNYLWKVVKCWFLLPPPTHPKRVKYREYIR